MDSKLIIQKEQHEFKFRKTDLDHDPIWFPLVLMNIKTPLPLGKVQPLSGGGFNDPYSFSSGEVADLSIDGRTPASQLSYE